MKRRQFVAARAALLRTIRKLGRDERRQLTKNPLVLRSTGGTYNVELQG